MRRTAVLVALWFATGCSAYALIGDRLGAGDGGAPCVAGELCLRVLNPTGFSTPTGHLVVLWDAPPQSLTPAPGRQVGYDVAFARAVPEVGLPMTAIALPDSAHLDCNRACTDLTNAACACTAGDVQVGSASLWLMEDLDGDGRIDEMEANGGVPLYGYGEPALVSSAMGYSPAPTGWDQVFPDGILAGVHPYYFVNQSIKSPHGYGLPLRLAPADKAWMLVVCPGWLGPLGPVTNCGSGIMTPPVP
jgi:hypothetical protein